MGVPPVSSFYYYAFGWCSCPSLLDTHYYAYVLCDAIGLSSLANASDDLLFVVEYSFGFSMRPVGVFLSVSFFRR